MKNKKLVEPVMTKIQAEMMNEIRIMEIRRAEIWEMQQYTRSVEIFLTYRIDKLRDSLKRSHDRTKGKK